MANWLFITDPENWSWDQQKIEGMQGSVWLQGTGTSGASLIEEMKNEELAFFAHAGNENKIMGIVKIVREAYNPEDSRNNTVDIAVVLTLINPVMKDVCRADPRLLPLHASIEAGPGVYPVLADAWQTACQYGGLPVAP